MPASDTRRGKTAFEARHGTPPDGIVLKKLSPAAPGAKRLALRHGSTLVCVRYREDEASGRGLILVLLSLPLVL